MSWLSGGRARPCYKRERRSFEVADRVSGKLVFGLCSAKSYCVRPCFGRSGSLAEAFLAMRVSCTLDFNYPVATMNISDEEFTRWRTLSQICQITRHGIVEGVEFDLRHELLAASEWRMDTIGVERAPYFKPANNGPFIWFPWYGEFNKDILRREAVANYEDEKKRLPQVMKEYNETFPGIKASKKTFVPMSVRRYMNEYTPDCVICSGDKLFITYVYRHFFGDEFDHPHDAEVRYALFAVRRTNGNIIHLKSPLRFNGSTAISGTDRLGQHRRK